MTPEEVAAIMAKHGDPNWHYQCWCQANTEGTWPCDTHRLAEALAASEAKVAKFDNILDQYTDGKISKVACVSLMLNAADS